MRDRMNGSSSSPSCIGTDGSLNEAAQRAPDITPDLQIQFMRWKNEFMNEIRKELKVEVKREVLLFFRQQRDGDRNKVTINSIGGDETTHKHIHKHGEARSFCSGRFGDIETATDDDRNMTKSSTTAEVEIIDTHHAGAITLTTHGESISQSPHDIEVLQEDVRTLKAQMHELLEVESEPHAVPVPRGLQLLQMSRQRQTSSRVLFMQNSPGGIDGNHSRERFCLEDDTFSLMMISPPCSQSWVLGLIAFALQTVLGIMIANNQVSAGVGSSVLDIPFKVDQVVRVGQVLTIILCLSTQDDVLTSIQTFLILGKGSNWDTVVGMEGNRSCSLWMTRIMLPTVLKFVQGIIVILVCLVIILQSADIIELLKDFTALMVLSDIDNIFYDLAVFGYLGEHLKFKTGEARNVKIERIRGIHDHSAIPTTSTGISFGNNVPGNNRSSILRKRRGFNTRSTLLFLLFAPQIICWLFVVMKQLDGTFFRQMYPECDAPNAYELAFEHFGNGQCYGGPLNTLGCGFEGGDCINFNLARPLCKGDKFVNVEERVGNGICDLEFGIYECDYDGYDCCPYDLVHNSSFGDGFCNGGQMSTPGCAYDGGDCNSLRETYPDCDLEALALEDGANEVILGDGICQGKFYNSETCGWENGDCNKGQLGQDILVDNAFVASVLHAPKHLFLRPKLSLDGSKLLISQHAPGPAGSVTMYGFNAGNSMWNQVGNTLSGTQWDDRFGSGLAMNVNGTRIAVGAPYDDDYKGSWGFYAAGYVKVFDFNEDGKNWIQLGATLKGLQQDHLGYILDMTADGSRLAIGGAGSERNGPDFEGEISVYDLHGSGQWTLIGQKIYGHLPWELIGAFSMHLSSSNGNRIIAQAFGYSEQTDEESLSKVFTYNQDSNEWVQLGQDIQSPHVGPKETSTSQISADGNRIAISSHVHRHYAGQVQVFDYNPMNSTWDQVGETITEPSTSDQSTEGNGFGWTLALSDDGNHLAVSMVNPDCDGGPDVHTLCATGSVFLYIYDSVTRKFQLIPSKRGSSIVTTGMIQTRSEKRDTVAYGLHLSFASDASRLSISSYDLSIDKGIVNVYDLDELFHIDCAVYDPFQISNGLCIPEDPFMSPECNWDGGDCPPPSPVEGYPDCFVAWPHLIGDGHCIISTPWNTKECGWDGGDCPEAVPVEGYPGCIAIPERIGDGECSFSWPYNTIECGFDGGDCL